MRIHACKPYHAQHRDLVHAIKLRRNLFALKMLVGEVSQEVAPLVEPVRTIMPAPSSLYSRLMGRFDLAWFLAHHLAKAYDKELASAPAGLHGRLRKRSRQTHRETVTLPACPPEAFDPELLIVDDVITTGFTMLQVATQSGWDFPNIQGLAIFDARKNPRSKVHT